MVVQCSRLLVCAERRLTCSRGRVRMKARLSRVVLCAGLGAWLGNASVGLSETRTEIDLALAQAPVTLVGANAANASGWGFASGDFDGDGSRDLAVLGAGTTADDFHPPFVTILFGPWTLSGSVDLANFAGTEATITAVSGDNGTWASIAAGDFNGDHIDDIALGVPTNTQGTNASGKVYVVYGGSTLRGASISLANPNVATTFYEPVPGSGGWLGYSMATGDVNNDGFDELLVSAPAFFPGGRVYALYGQQSFPTTVHLDTLSTHVTTIVEDDWYQGCGFGLDCADANADGFDDILIGASGDGIEVPGTVFMVMGAESLPTTLAVSDASSSARRFFGEGAYDSFGWRVRFADVNGDGRLDPVIAAPYADPRGCVDCGEIYVIYWSDSLPDTMSMSNATVPMTRFIGAGDSPSYGETMTTGRINADLAEDLVIKREADGLIPGDRRSVVVAYGSASLPDTVFLDADSTLTHILAEQPGDYLGLGLAITDLDADGLGDMCIGAPFANVAGKYGAGKVHVFYGCATTSSVSPGAPALSRLHAYPNPFNPGTTIEYSVPMTADVRIEIFDVRGAVVRALVMGRAPAGRHRVSWDGRDDAGRAVASGVYFCRLVAGSFTDTKKLTILK